MTAILPAPALTASSARVAGGANPPAASVAQPVSSAHDALHVEVPPPAQVANPPESSVTLRASAETTLEAATLPRGKAHYLQEASALSTEDVAARLHDLDVVQTQGQQSARQLLQLRTENAQLHEALGQWQYGSLVALGLVLVLGSWVLMRAWASRRAKRAPPRPWHQSSLQPDAAPLPPNPKETESAADEPRAEEVTFALPHGAIETIEPVEVVEAEERQPEAPAPTPERTRDWSAAADTAAPTHTQELEVQSSSASKRPGPWYWPWAKAQQKPQQKPQWEEPPSRAAAEGDQADDASGRVSEIWADSHDWLQSDSILPERPAKAAPPAEPQRVAQTGAFTRSEEVSGLEQDAQPQPGQSLVSYIRSLNRSVQRLLDVGKLREARALLFEHLRLVPDTSPWAYLAFLALHTEENPKYREIRGRFSERFGREAPALGEEKNNPLFMRGMVDYQYSMAQMVQAWPTERAVLLLEEWLASGKRRTFTLQAYDDLFALYDILDNLNGIHGNTGFQPLFDSMGRALKGSK